MATSDLFAAWGPASSKRPPGSTPAGSTPGLAGEPSEAHAGWDDSARASIGDEVAPGRKESEPEEFELSFSGSAPGACLVCPSAAAAGPADGLVAAAAAAGGHGGGGGRGGVRVGDLALQTLPRVRASAPLYEALLLFKQVRA